MSRQNLKLSLYYCRHCTKLCYCHPRSGVCNSFGCVSLSVCLSVCQTITFESLNWRRKFIFAHAAYLHNLRVEFVYEGHRVKKVENSHSRNVNLASIVRPNTEPWCLHASRGFRIRHIEWCGRRLCYVTGSDHAELNARIRGWSALDEKAILFPLVLQSQCLLLIVQMVLLLRWILLLLL